VITLLGNNAVCGRQLCTFLYTHVRDKATSAFKRVKAETTSAMRKSISMRATPRISQSGPDVCAHFYRKDQKNGRVDFLHYYYYIGDALCTLAHATRGRLTQIQLALGPRHESRGRAHALLAARGHSILCIVGNWLAG
jgi:hypothetical protein